MQCGSFSGAAQKLYISQSAISHQIKALEQELGVKLFVRVGRGISPTPEGERLAHYARSILHSIDDLETEFSELALQPHGTIRIAAFRGVAMFHLPWVVKRFRQQYPEVNLVLSGKTYDSDIIAAVSHGDADIGIASSWNEFEDVDYFEILKYDMFVCTPLNHPWVGRQAPLALNEIAEEPLMLYEKGTSIRRRIDEIFAKHGLNPEVPIEVAGFLALREYVRIGLGIAIASGLMIADRTEDVIHALPVTDIFGQLGYGVVLRKGRYVSAALNAFMHATGVPKEKIPTVV